jgi:hypothetical protein
VQLRWIITGLLEKHPNELREADAYRHAGAVSAERLGSLNQPNAGTRLDAHGRVPKSATSDGDKAKGPAVPVAVFGGVLPWQ